MLHRASAPITCSSSTEPTMPGALPRPISYAPLMALLFGLAPALVPPTSSSASITRVRSPEQLELASGLTTLGIIPKVRRRRGADWPIRAQL